MKFRRQRGQQHAPHIVVGHELLERVRVALGAAQNGIDRLWIEGVTEVVEVVGARLLGQRIILGQVVVDLIPEQLVVLVEISAELVVDDGDDRREW